MNWWKWRLKRALAAHRKAQSLANAVRALSMGHPDFATNEDVGVLCDEEEARRQDVLRLLGMKP